MEKETAGKDRLLLGPTWRRRCAAAKAATPRPLSRREKAAPAGVITEERASGRVLHVRRALIHGGQRGGGAGQSRVGANAKDVAKCFRCTGSQRRLLLLMTSADK